MIKARYSFPMICLTASALALGAASSLAQTEAQGEGTVLTNPHHNFVKEFEGTKTCLACHQAQAEHAFGSIHYQWKAPAPNLVNGGGRKIGKINSTNDFCTNRRFSGSRSSPTTRAR